MWAFSGKMEAGLRSENAPFIVMPHGLTVKPVPAFAGPRTAIAEQSPAFGMTVPHKTVAEPH
jgi:hypothetical protein